MVLEQNAVPGFTNRRLAPFVRAAAVTYDGTLAYFRGRGFVTGNPVRPEFERTAVGASNAPHPPRVLTLGGSQGSHAINVAMVAAAPELARRCPHLEIVHQTGTRDETWVRDQYDAAGIPARVVNFLDAVAREMKEADVVVSRAGATTLAELAALGRPAVLIPLPTATDDHQRKNAQALADRGAARLVDQAGLDVDPTPLVEAVGGLLENPSVRTDMGAAMHRFARPDAAARIVSRLLELAA